MAEGMGTSGRADLGRAGALRAPPPHFSTTDASPKLNLLDYLRVCFPMHGTSLTHTIAIAFRNLPSWGTIRIPHKGFTGAIERTAPPPGEFPEVWSPLLVHSAPPSRGPAIREVGLLETEGAGLPIQLPDGTQMTTGQYWTDNWPCAYRYPGNLWSHEDMAGEIAFNDLGTPFRLVFEGQTLVWRSAYIKREAGNRQWIYPQAGTSILNWCFIRCPHILPIHMTPSRSASTERPTNGRCWRGASERGRITR